MKASEFERVCSIMEDSETWDNETLTRCPKLFLLVRAAWLDAKNGEDSLLCQRNPLSGNE